LLKAEREGGEVVAVFNDTLAELPHMRAWVRLVENFMGSNMIVTKPPEPLTFWWGTVMRGYPAPNFKFRWCTKYLKAVPTKIALKDLEGLLVTGSRREESAYRRAKVSQVFEEDGLTKAAPLYDLSEAEVWKLLGELEPYAEKLGFPDLKLLKRLYSKGSRFGCWFCTVAREQRGLASLGAFADDYRLAESFIISFRAFLWDLRKERVPKSSGYSRLGSLSVRARAKALAAFKAASEVEGWVEVEGERVELFYGLHEEGYITGLRHVDALYKADPRVVEERAKAMGFIRKISERTAEAEEVRELAAQLYDEVKEELLSGGRASYLSY